jgi:hypothetical protein
MWFFRSKPAEGEGEGDDEGSYEDDDDDDDLKDNDFEYETGEEGDDEASKYSRNVALKGSRPPIVPLGKDVLSVADSSVQASTDNENDNDTNSLMTDTDVGDTGKTMTTLTAEQELNVNAHAKSAVTRGSDNGKQTDDDASSVEATNGNCKMNPPKGKGNGNGNGTAAGNAKHGDGSGSGKPKNQNGANDNDGEHEDHNMDTVVDDDSLEGGIPENVYHSNSRNRLPSGLSLGDDEHIAASFDDDDDDDDVETEKEPEKEEKEEEPEEVTSMAEKQSLLVLAAEHDRVDILQAILATQDNSAQDKSTLLHATSCTSIPPLHIAVSYGSVNATNCLLRMGADPSIRPNVAAIQKEQKRIESPVDIHNIRKFDNVSAWELVFGCGQGGQQKKSGWSLFGSSSSSKSSLAPEEEEDTDVLSESVVGNNSTQQQPQQIQIRKPPRSVEPVNMAPSKREGIRHAFTAEALRCIGSDEVDRLRQLLESGMPMSIDIGGKNLYDWSVEMSASQCEQLLRPSQAERSDDNNNGDNNGNSEIAAAADGTSNNKDSDNNDNGNNNNTASSTTATGGSKKTAVLDRPDHESAMHLVNRLDELESLSRALSVCLDNLAEEVSVSHGLLLMGGGASALASHVRSLKALKERKYEELVRMQEAWENSEDELAYWVKESGVEGKRIAALMKSSLAAETTRQTPLPEATCPDEEKAQKQQLQAQIGASETKIRKLRVSIADLSEENVRNLKEVQKRGLTGGINLVRGLREEIREIEFELSEAKSAEATCRTKISLIQSSLQASRKHLPSKAKDGSTSEQPVDSQAQAATAPSEVGVGVRAESGQEDNKTASERIYAGESTAMVVRGSGNRGFLSLWQILLRIIGMGEERPTSDDCISRTTMII